MKTYEDFLAAISTVIGREPDQDAPMWSVETDAGRLQLWLCYHEQADLTMCFIKPGPLLADLGANPHNGHWNISPPSFMVEGQVPLIELQRQAVLQELQKRLARVGYVPPVSPSEGRSYDYLHWQRLSYVTYGG